MAATVQLPASAINIKTEYSTDSIGANEAPNWDPDGAILKAHFKAAVDIWEDLIPSPGNYEFDFQWDDDIDGLGLTTDLGFIDRYIEINPNRDWWIDPTPQDSAEFNFTHTFYEQLPKETQEFLFPGRTPPGKLEVALRGIGLDGFNNSSGQPQANASTGYDLLSVALHEIGHILGIGAEHVPYVNIGGEPGEFNISPHQVGGLTNVLVKETDFPNDPGHLDAAPGYGDAWPFLMVQIMRPGMRVLPSATDVLVIAEDQSLRQVDLPRRYFIGGASTNRWDSSLNWLGGAPPWGDEDVFILDDHDVSLTWSSQAAAANLTVSESSKLAINGYLSLNAPGAGGGKLTVDSGKVVLGSSAGSYGYLNCERAVITNNSELAMDGGRVTAYSMRVDDTSQVTGWGNISVGDNVTLIGSLMPANGHLSINGRSVQLNDETKIFVSDGSLRIDGDIEYGEAYGSFGGTLHITNGHAFELNSDFNTSSVNTTGGSSRVRIVGTDSKFRINGNLNLQTERGSDATMVVKRGGLVEAENASIGGVLTVDGAGSRFDVGIPSMPIEPGEPAWIIGGGLNVGSPATTGRFRVTNGAILDTYDGKGSYEFVGFGALASGSVRGSISVIGRGSEWLSDGLVMGFGANSEGALVIDDGGYVRTSGVARIGGSRGKGSVTVTGPQSLWEVTDSIYLGDGTASGRATVGEGAEIRLGDVPGAILQVSEHSELLGNGTITGDVACNGRCAPGMSVGTLLVDGDYSQSNSGILEIEVGGLGLVPGVDFDLLHVTGTAALGGFLDIVSLVPVPFGTTYDLSEFVSAESLKILDGFQLAADDLSQWRLDGTTVISIPEPAGISLAMTCLFALVVNVTRCHRASSHMGQLEKQAKIPSNCKAVCTQSQGQTRNWEAEARLQQALIAQSWNSSHGYFLVAIRQHRRNAMRQFLVTPAILVMISLAFASSAHAENITYLVNPVMFSDDLSLQGGFITTNGTLGPLAPSDILDYEFVVSAPNYPYTFQPDNPGAAIGITGTILATPSQVVLPIDTDPSSGTANELNIGAFDNSLAECGDCSQHVGYGAGLTGSPSSPVNMSLVDYLYADPSDEIPALYRMVRYEPQQVIVIAEIPEPSALVLALVGVSLLAKRKRAQEKIRQA